MPNDNNCSIDADRAVYGYVYKTTNLINKKIYIGRHMSHKYDKWYFGSGAKIRAALPKYGEENFSNEVLYWCYSEDELNEREKSAIEEYNSRDPDIGYNINPGGTHGNWLSDLDEDSANRYRQMFSEMSKSGKCGNKGKHLSEKHKARIGNSNRGKVRSEEWIRNQSQACKGRIAWNKGLTAEDDRVKKYVRKPGEYSHSEETRAKMREKARSRDYSNYGKRLKGKIYVNNGIEVKVICPEEFDQYVSQGYVRGYGKCRQKSTTSELL